MITVFFGKLVSNPPNLPAWNLFRHHAATSKADTSARHHFLPSRPRSLPIAFLRPGEVLSAAFSRRWLRFVPTWARSGTTGFLVVGDGCGELQVIAVGSLLKLRPATIVRIRPTLRYSTGPLNAPKHRLLTPTTITTHSTWFPARWAWWVPCLPRWQGPAATWVAIEFLPGTPVYGSAPAGLESVDVGYFETWSTVLGSAHFYANLYRFWGPTCGLQPRACRSRIEPDWTCSASAAASTCVRPQARDVWRAGHVGETPVHPAPRLNEFCRCRFSPWLISACFPEFSLSGSRYNLRSP